jgi:hypothetical protein
VTLFIDQAIPVAYNGEGDDLLTKNAQASV